MPLQLSTTPVICLLAVGAPLAVELVPQPSQQQVDALHARFCTALAELYDTHKAQYGDQDVPLVME